MNVSTLRGLIGRSLLAGGFLALAVPAALAQGSGDDAIRLRNGQFLRRIEVLGEGLKEVTYKSRGKESQVTATDVAEIQWGNAGESYDRAKFAFDRRDYALAANLFQEVANQSDRAPLKAHAGYKAAESLYQAAVGNPPQASAAAQGLQAWVAANPEHRLMPSARQLLGRAWQLAGNADEAVNAFKALETEVGAKGLGADWVARAKYGQGQALVAKKDFQGGRQAYLAASATLATVDLGESPEILALAVAAKVGEGECYLAEGRHDEARRFFNALATASAANPAMLAAAKCGEAEALFEIARAKKDTRELREAQLAFALVSATDMADGDASAKAAYYLGQCLLEFGREGEGADFAQRATAYFEGIVQNYPNSRWAGPARLALKK